MIKKEITYGEIPYIAYDDIIGGRQVFIIYMGSHPCAYIEEIKRAVEWLNEK